MRWMMFWDKAKDKDKVVVALPPPKLRLEDLSEDPAERAPVALSKKLKPEVTQGDKPYLSTTRSGELVVKAPLRIQFKIRDRAMEAGVAPCACGGTPIPGYIGSPATGMVEAIVIRCATCSKAVTEPVDYLADVTDAHIDRCVQRWALTQQLSLPDSGPCKKCGQIGLDCNCSGRVFALIGNINKGEKMQNVQSAPLVYANGGKFIGTKLVEVLGQHEHEGRMGYKIQYPDGYISWSPADVFEASYRRIEMMTFGQALEAMKKGFRVARRGWNGKGMWLTISPGANNFPADKFWNAHNRAFAERNGGVADCLPCITMKTADNKIQMGWLASQSDMLGEDWELLDHEVKL